MWRAQKESSNNASKMAVAEGEIGVLVLSSLWHHVVGSHVVYPGVAYLELAFANGIGAEKGLSTASIVDIRFLRIWNLALSTQLYAD